MFIAFPLAMPSSRRRRWVLLLWAVVLGSSARAQPALTLDDALRAAQARSHQLPAQDAAARAAREMAVAAGQRADPMLTVGVSNLPIDGPDRFSVSRDFMTMRSIGLMQELTRADKRLARATRFEREAEAAEAGRALSLAELQRETARAWLDVHFQQQLRDLLVAQRAEAAQQVIAADAALRGGRGSQADVIAAHAAVAQIDERSQRAERELASARIRLARWVGDAAEQPLAPAPSTTRVRWDVQALDAQVVQQDPRIALLNRQEATAEADAEIARSNRKPDWSVEVMYSQRGSAYANMLSLNLRVPLQLNQAQRQDRELAAQLAKIDQLRAEREELTRERTAQARDWLQRWQRNRERLAGYDRALIPFAADRTQALVAAYRGGGGSLAGVLEARRMEIDVRMERVALEMETAALWAQLEYLLPAAPPAAAAVGRTAPQESVQ
jgi:outer membrane protein TolC